MADEPADLVLEHLKRSQAKLDVMALDSGDPKGRLPVMEANQGQLVLRLGTMSGRMDRVDGRLSRIERRPDLIEA